LTELGGNLSPNLLDEQKKPTALFLNLFSFNFQYASGFQQANIDLIKEYQRGFAYILYPSKNNMDQREWEHLKILFDQLCVKRAHLFNAPQLILNLDFIPYTSHPLIILGDDGEFATQLSQKLQKILGNQVNILISNKFFQGGKLYSDLQSVLPSPKFKIVNLLISFNFFSSYPLLKAFFKAWI
jgi:hypothetical protein